MSAVLKAQHRRELLIGCGGKRDKHVKFDGIPPVFQDLVTLDIEPSHNPDVVWDLNVLPYPFADEEFDEIHAYEVLEHCGRQGDIKFFFAQFEEFYRILKPGGFFCASVPSWDGEWAWADPGHTRVIAPKTLMFLEQKFYETQVGVSAASDYRSMYKGDFITLGMQESGPQFFFILKKV